MSGYDEVCTVPCTMSMPAGTHTFAVAKPGGSPREAGAVTLPAGSTNMAISYVDRTPLRAGTGLVGVGAVIAGFAVLISDSGSSSPSFAGPLVLASVGGGLLGLAFVLPDGSKVTVGPGVTAPRANNPSNGSNRWLGQRAQDANARGPLPGLTITAQF